MSLITKFLTAMSRTRSKKFRRGHRNARPKLELLEDRTLLSATGAHVFAQFEGTLASPTDTQQIALTIRPEDFTLNGGMTILGFHLKAGAQSSLDPAAVEIRNANGDLIPTGFVHADLCDNTQSLVLVKPGYGNYQLTVRGERQSAGNYQLDVFLGGDVNGDRAVTTQDADALHSLIGSITGDGRYRVEADLNLDGQITGVDYAYGKHNVGDSTRLHPMSLTLGLSPAVTLPDGRLITNVPTPTVMGTTNAGVRVDLETDSDGLFDEGYTIADASGRYSLPAPLTDGNNTIEVRGRDGFGQERFATLDVIRQDEVLRWNQVALAAVQLDATTPPLASRNLAMISLAIFDTINAIEGTPSYAVSLPAPPGAAPQAAVAAAAHRVLSYLYPAQQALFDAELADTPVGAGSMDGLALGRAIADAIIALRANDGSRHYADYFPGDDPGDWQPTPPMFDVALLPQWATLQPFAMSSPNQFRPDGPPPLNSPEYTAAFNEVKELGRANSGTRTTEQTQIARFWADGLGTVTPPGHWNQIAAQFALAQGNSLAENARLFAMLNVAMADAGIVAWDAKYSFDTWRPVTAIRAADTDGNADTVLDSTWTSLLVTPPFPEYVSGHSTFSAAAAGILTEFFGNTAFDNTVTLASGATVTRHFSSFTHAASEAGQSRIYGGIHFQFANQDGQAAGAQLAQYVLERFSTTVDVTGPSIVMRTPANQVVSTNLQLQGQVLDNLSGVASLAMAIDDSEFQPVALDAAGNFSIPTNFSLDGSADGRHVLALQALDVAGNVSMAEFSFTLDTQAPQLTLTSPLENSDLTAGMRLTGIAYGTGSSITQLTYAFNDGESVPVSFIPIKGEFDQVLNLADLAVGPHTLTITARDAAGLTTSVTLTVNLSALIPFTVSSFTPQDGADEVGSTFRPQVHFSRPVDPTSLNADNFFATDATGTKLPATIVPANDGSFAWLFFAAPMPGSSRITVSVDGTIRAADGTLLDADGDGTPGGVLQSAFITVSRTPVLGTRLVGVVADPGPDLKPGSFDDVRPGSDGVLMTGDDIYLFPLAGVRVFILGLEDEYVMTDSDGRFELNAVPTGNIKLAVDGLTTTSTPSGIYFPEMVMDMHIQPGITQTVMAAMEPDPTQVADMTALGVYLPRLQTSILQAVSNSNTTTIGVNATSAPELTPEQRQFLSIEVQPGSLIGPDGQPLAMGQVGISTVPPELVREMLPPGLMQHTFDITVQAPGISTFATPAPMTFPNVFNAAPGTQLNFLSFDHTTGQLVIEGTATVSADGLSVRTDPGTGITHPGWHGLTPDGSNTCQPPAPDETAPEIDVEPIPEIGEVGSFKPLANHLFTNDGESYVLTLSNKARSVRVNDAECARIPRETPLVVEFTVAGPANEFLTGLPQSGFQLTLHPGGSVQMTVRARDLLRDAMGNPLKHDMDVFYGARVDLKGTNARTGQVLFEGQFYVYRYLDAADTNHTDRILEMPDTTNDGKTQSLDGVIRLRPFVNKFGDSGTPTFVVRDETHFRYNDTTEQFVFDPTTTSHGLQTEVEIVTPFTANFPARPLTPTLTIRGNAIRQEWFVDTGMFVNVLEQLADGRLAGASSGERDLIDNVGTAGAPLTERENIVSRAIARAETLMDLYRTPGPDGFVGTDDDGGWRRVATPTADSVNIRQFHAGSLGGHLGEANAPGLGVDNQGIADLLAHRNEYGVAEQNFRLSRVLNENSIGEVRLFVDRFFGDPLADFDSLGGDALINTLGKSIAHELGHHLGLNHTLGVTASSVTKQIVHAGALTDVMAQGFDFAGARTFGVTEAAFKVAVGVEWDPAEAQQALDYFALYNQAVQGPPDLGSPFDSNGEVPDGSEGMGPPLDDGVLTVYTDPQLTYASDLDFGTVSVDGPGGTLVTQLLLLVNSGGQDLTINSVSLQGNGAAFVMTMVPAGTVLSPGESRSFALTFDPLTSGMHQATLVIDNDGAVPVYRIDLAAFGLSPDGDIRVEVANNNIGGLSLNAAPLTADDFMIVRNIGSRALTISNIAPDAGSIGQFTVAGFGPNNPLVLQPGESMPLDVVFEANALGLQRGRIQIFSDDPETPIFTQTVVGTGLAAIGTALQSGNDFVAVETPDVRNTPVLRLRSDSTGHWEVFLPAETAMHYFTYDPSSGLIAEGFAMTAVSGRPTTLPVPFFGASTAPDSDGDGLPDDVEFAVGTSSARTDSDNDGTDDFAELQQRLDPLSGRGFPTGSIASVEFAGQTPSDIAVTETTAFVANDRGLSLIDISRPDRPRLVSQLSLPFATVAVSVDTRLDVAVVATRDNTLHLIDVSDIAGPVVRQTIAVPQQIYDVEAVDGVVYVSSLRGLDALDLRTGASLDALVIETSQLARDGDMLYTLSPDFDLSKQFSVVNIADPTDLQRVGSLSLSIDTLPGGASSIFAGDGVVYLAQGPDGTPPIYHGLVTIDVSIPSAPALISERDTVFSIPSLAANGAGQAVTVLLSGTGNYDVGVLDVSDPQITDAVRFILPTLEQAMHVVLASGLAFVLEDSRFRDLKNFLTVVNYLPIDVEGLVPTVTISTTVEDIDPLTAGVQIVEGSRIPLRIQAADDVLVAKIEVLLNGAVYSTDVSYPWDLNVFASADSVPFGTATIQVRATDTGGNMAFSNTLTVELRPDTFAPTIENIVQTESATELQTIGVLFSEAMEVSTLTPQTLYLRSQEGMIITPRSVQSLQAGRFVQLTFETLPLGTYELVLDATAITDLAGNPLGADLVVMDLVANGLPPTLMTINPCNGDQISLGLQTIEVRFSEPMDRATLTTLQLRGSDGTPLMPVSISTREGDRLVELRFETLPLGNYELILAAALTDRAGEPLGTTPIVSRFTVVDPFSFEKIFPDRVYLTGENPQHIASGDVNGDGNIDLVTVNHIGLNGVLDGVPDTVSVLLGRGDGTFAAPCHLAVSDRPMAVVLADIDNDGDLDIVTVNDPVGNNNVSVFLGFGDGTFAPHIDYEVAARSTYLTVGDVNGDGQLDIVTIGDNAGSVLRGDGMGRFMDRSDFALDNAHTATLADVNNDGHLDLLVSRTDRFDVLLGDGDGTFATATTYVVNTTFLAGASFLDVADLDGDGDLDVVALGGNYASVWFGHEGGFVFQAEYDVRGGLDPVVSLRLADLTNDGLPDLLVTRTTTLAVLPGRSDGTFDSFTTFPARFDLRRSALFPRGLAVADYDSDGDLDLALPEARGSVAIMLGNGDGSFPIATDYETGTNPGGDTETQGDVNGDGHLDIVRVNDHSVTILFGHGDGTYPARHDYLVGGSLQSVALEDLDNDGDLDFVATAAGLTSPRLNSLVGSNPMPPAVTVITTATDIDLNTPGLQVVEGSLLTFGARVALNAAVANVELLVNGEAVPKDLFHPLQLSIMVPTLALGSGTITVQARATDLNSVTTTSEVLNFDIVADIFAPTVLSITPADGSMRQEGPQVVRIRFSEPLETTTVTTSTFQLRDASGNVVEPSLLQLGSGDRLVQLTYPYLLAGSYQLVIAPTVTDRFGNTLATEVVSLLTLTPRANLSTTTLEVYENNPIALDVTVDASVQVQTVELLVNGVVVSSDSAAPFTFAITAPNITPQIATLVLQTRVTDSAGITTLSNTLVIVLLDDITPPSVVNVFPANDAVIGPGSNIVEVRFSEPLDPATITNAQFQLYEAGPGGVFDDGNDVLVPLANLQFLDGNRTVRLTTQNALTAGNYQLRIQESGVMDLAGNALGTGVYRSNFRVVTDSVIADPQGDTFGTGPVQLDIQSVSGVVENGNLILTMTFFTPIAPLFPRRPESVIGYWDLDLDQNPTTGSASHQGLAPAGHQGGPLGVEAFIDLRGGIDAPPGRVPLIIDFRLAGYVPITYTPTSFQITIPLALLGDDGLLNYGTLIGTFSEWTDAAPNGQVGTVGP